MKILNKDIEEFIDIYSSLFNITLTESDAYEKLSTLLLHVGTSVSSRLDNYENENIDDDARSAAL